MLRMLGGIILILSLVGCDRPFDSVSASELKDWDTKYILVDVRSDREFADGHVRDAVHLPVDQLSQRAASMLPAKQAPLVVYCKSGGRAKRAAQTFSELGYTKIHVVQGGYVDLVAAGFTPEAASAPVAP